jgi:hypothetical protein
MTDIALTEWEHQPHVLKVLTSKEMGAWLGRRDSRILQEIRQDITEIPMTIQKTRCFNEREISDYRSDILKVIDKHIEGRKG